MHSATPSTETAPVIPSRAGDFLFIDLELLDDNPFQPRTQMDPAKVGELAASIAQSGLLQPIAVRPHGAGRYQVVAGHSRRDAFRQLLAAATTETGRRQYAQIKAHVVPVVTDQQMALAAYVENAVRSDLNPIEEATALMRIKELGNLPNATDLAKATGQPERRVRRLLKLATAPQVVKDGVTVGVLVDVAEAGSAPRRSRRHLDLRGALEFTRLFEHHAKQKVATAETRTATAMQRALREDWGLRRVEGYVDRVLAGNLAPAPTPGNDGVDGAQPVEAAEAANPGDPAPTAPVPGTNTDEPPVRELRTGEANSSARSQQDGPFCSLTPERLLLRLSRLFDATTAELYDAKRDLQGVLIAVNERLKLRAADSAARKA